jgi:hypothetical protein
MKIDNLTIRHGDSFAFINLVFSFRPDEQMRDAFLKSTNKYKEVRVMDSQEDYEKFLDGLEMVVSPEVDTSGYHPVEFFYGYDKSPETKVTYEPSSIRHIPKFDKFVYTEYIQYNEITLGAMRMLSNKEKFEQEDSGADLLMRIITCLDLFWD